MREISVLIATLNGEKTIAKAIASVQAQTFKDVEIIVVDDGSTDGTFDLVKALVAQDDRIKIIRLPRNLGVGSARNMALANATGAWITILDADDWFEPKRLEALLEAAKNNNADLVADNLNIFDHIRKNIVATTRHGGRRRIVPLTAKRFFESDTPLAAHPMGFIQPLIRRQFLLDHHIVYDQNHKVGEDFLFVADILLDGARAFIIPGAYYTYVHRISPTTRKISPFSHSKVDSVFSLIMRGCDEILQKHGSKMDKKTSQALLKRRRIFEGATKYEQARDAFRHGKFSELTQLVLEHPIVLLFIGSIVTRFLISNVRAFLRLPDTRGRNFLP